MESQGERIGEKRSFYMFTTGAIIQSYLDNSCYPC